MMEEVKMDRNKDHKPSSSLYSIFLKFAVAEHRAFVDTSMSSLACLAVADFYVSHHHTIRQQTTSVEY